MIIHAETEGGGEKEKEPRTVTASGASRGAESSSLGTTSLAGPRFVSVPPGTRGAYGTKRE